VTLLLFAPLLVPLLAASVGLAAWRSPRVQMGLNVAGAALHLASAIVLLVLVLDRGPLAVQAGAWPAPFGITIAADVFSALLVLLASVVSLVVAVYQTADVPEPARQGGGPVLQQVLVLGATGAFLTGDLFNLYVWFEVSLVGFFGLLAIEGTRRGAEATIRAIVPSLLGSALFLVAAGATYGLAGTLNLADLHERLPALAAERPGAVGAIGSALAAAFALKAGLVPLHVWLPVSYHVPSPGTCALFAATLTKVGAYALVRVLALPWESAVGPIAGVVLVVSAVTMLLGVLGAVAQYEIKRILAWHTISQTGYIVVGVGLLGHPEPSVRRAGLVAVVLFMIHHGLVKPALFLVAGLVQRRAGTTDLASTGGLARSSPLLTALFLVAAGSLAGLPPSSGLWAKYAVIRATVEGAAWWVLAASLVAGLLTLTSMLKIQVQAFWRDRPDGAPEPGRVPPVMTAATLALVGLVAVIGLYPGPLLTWCETAADQLLDPSGYVESVLGAEGGGPGADGEEGG